MMLEKPESDGNLGRVAAGPLEHLIDVYGYKALQLIEEECKSHTRLQLALSHVWLIYV